MSILSAHQPCYLPWLGYFNKIVNSDIFVILDDVQFEKNSYINRVQIKTPQGAHWLTIPVQMKGHTEKSINEIDVVGHGWREKHQKTLVCNYARAEHFDEDFINFPVLWGEYLVHWLWHFLFEIMNIMELHTSTICGQPDIAGQKQDLIINLCKYYKADTFLFGAKGRDYVDVDLFKRHGIKPVFQDFKCVEYPQLWGDFIPGLSVIDALFNVGPEKTKELICQGFSL